ncbi:hypothetical protein HMPREF0043_01368 [Actinobaculum sp. oral taxon 183 str. F0552]|nr:hypothetical protein HMPREF0043_01368 [Actinobaculum sp. oral taxon 183 str. F0552]
MRIVRGPRPSDRAVGFRGASGEARRTAGSTIVRRTDARLTLRR